jgi:ABC-type sugar transport system substrate-binding protein
VKAAQAYLKAHFGTPKFVAPGPAFNIHKVKKPVWFIAQVTSLPVTPYIDQGFLQAAKVAGVPAHICQGYGTPQGNTTCIDQAIAAHAGSVEIFSVEPNTIETALKKAQAAGVKTVAGNDAPYIGAPNQPGIDASVSHDYTGAGALSGAYAVATWGGATDSICLAIPEFLVTQSVCKGFTAEVHKFCASCKVQTKEIPLAELATESASVVNAAVLSDPKINYIEGSIDDFCGIVAPTLKTLGKSPSQIACAGQNGNVPSLINIRQDGYQWMSAGQNTFWWGWAFFDAAARVQVQAMPKAVITTPNELFTRQDFTYKGPIDYNHTAQAYGVPNSYWQSQYKKLWGLK